jgi:prepilin peptidase CpaA
MLETASLIIFPAFMAFAASSDLLTMRISNRLVLLLAAAFLPVALLAGLSLEQVGMHLLCGLAVLVVTFTLFALRWIGGGDAKLAAATALWLGFDLTPAYLLYASLFGGLLTLALLGMRRVPLEPLFAGRPSLHWLSRLHDPKQGVPYGIAMAIAGLLIYSQTTIFERLTA